MRVWKSVPTVTIPALNRADLAQEDELREENGLPPRFAVPYDALCRPQTDGVWDSLDAETRRWRLRVSSPGALSLNFGFTAYDMPAGGQMIVRAVDGTHKLPPFTNLDNADHGELWTPVVLADDVLIEVTVPRDQAEWLVLELTSINVGYRFFGETQSNRSGWCNIDVICPEGDGWRDEIPSVGVISTGGSTFCTGFMVNNTAEDETPYFMTANHCGISSGNASSLVVYWNFESPTCGQQGGGSLSQSQTGSYYRASYSSSDFTLVELDSLPDPSWGVTYAGWNRGAGNPASAVAIHHPNTDEKSISFEYDPCTTTSYLGTSQPGDGTHIRVADWDEGTTEPGSSGSPLFDQNHRVVGQLHGGYAACGNNSADWYGRFSVSWSHGLSQYLDPLNTGQTTLDTLVPGATGMRVSPAGGLDAGGDPGGPFTPSSETYTIENQGSSGISYAVTKSADWVSISNASGYLGVGQSADVVVSINASANSLPLGTYTDTVAFINQTNGDGDTARTVELTVGAPSLVYSFPMNANPGWSTQGLWAFGQPSGDGGQYGNADPGSAHTGSNVYGYNLSGDYENNLSERHLTTTAIDCSDLSDVSVKFWRYLNVEQPSYDHAYVRVSSNGSTWTTVWENASEITDSSWTQHEYDISDVADGQATVYIRWTMGTTDSSWRFSGWNIDDVEIWGVSACSAPVVNGQPQDVTRCAGLDATFTIAADGGDTLGYQWRKNGQIIGGATSATYTIYGVTPADAGSYDCIVTNDCGSVMSSPAVLDVLAAPSIGAQPADQVAGIGQSATFSITADGDGPLDLQWYHDGSAIAGATDTILTLTAIDASDAGMYRCSVSNDCATVWSAMAELSVHALGDLNCDGNVSAADIDGFVLALTGGPGDYSVAYPECRYELADCNADGTVSAADIDAFVLALTTGR
jgi:hypothetical protein